MKNSVEGMSMNGKDKRSYKLMGTALIDIYEMKNHKLTVQTVL